jgi:hypothetical protein
MHDVYIIIYPIILLYFLLSIKLKKHIGNNYVKISQLRAGLPTSKIDVCEQPN